MPAKTPAGKHQFDEVSLTVGLEGRQVGTLALTPDGLAAFAYDEAWLAEGFSISPFSLPLERRVFVPKLHPFDGLFGVFADSLPDGWGRLLVDRLIAQQGADPYEVDQLNRLAIVGSSGMGALTYEPQTEFARPEQLEDLDAIAQECAALLETGKTDDLDELFALGGSSGGARPKALVKIEGEDWIVKFPSSYDAPNIGKVEYRYSLAAGECGIAMPETRLFPSKRCAGYFGAKRFDRVSDGKGKAPCRVHMVSAGALLEASHRVPSLDYHHLMKLTLSITKSMTEVERLYRLMCFNVFFGNRDDHAKNFSYLYAAAKDRWLLSPAYDLTPNAGMSGEHATTVDGKGRSIEEADLVAVGVAAGLPQSRCVEIARSIRDVVGDVRNSCEKV